MGNKLVPRFKPPRDPEVNPMKAANRKSSTGRRPAKKHRRGPYGLTVPEAGAMIGLGRNASYDAVKAGKIPVLEYGTLKIVPRIPWLKQLGVDVLTQEKPQE
jgi:hypothetical protein